MTPDAGQGNVERAAVEELAGQLRVVVNRLSFHLRRAGSQHDLTPSRFSALIALEKGGPQRAGDLAALLDISPASMSRLREALEDAGWVARAPDPGDQRAYQISITEAGAALLEETRREGTGRLTEHILALDAEQRRALEAALPALVSLADRHLGQQRNE